MCSKAHFVSSLPSKISVRIKLSWVMNGVLKFHIFIYIEGNAKFSMNENSDISYN